MTDIIGNNRSSENIIVLDTFTYLDAGGEQTIFEITSSSKTFISQIMLDMNNIAQNGVITLYSKIDGTNYREMAIYGFTFLTDSKGLLINLKIPVDTDFKITYTEDFDEGAARTIPYKYILEN
jgi:hypothetical protein